MALRQYLPLVERFDTLFEREGSVLMSAMDDSLRARVRALPAGALIGLAVLAILACEETATPGGGPAGGAAPQAVLGRSDVAVAGRAATAGQRFGSVTQSSNVDSSGDTTDRVTVTGDGTRLIMQVRNAATGAERFSLNTRDDLATAVRGGDSEEVGRFVLSKTLANGDVAVAALYNLTDDSTASAGYWTLLRGGAPQEVGGFGDGEELSAADPWSRPSGTARYSGSGEGVIHRLRSGASASTQYFLVDATLTANFGAGAVTGEVGGLRVLARVDANSCCAGRVIDAGGRPLPIATLGAARIASDGTFKARGSGAGRVIRDVSAVAGDVALPALTAGDVASASASWGGAFSTDGDKVMAIFGLDYELADGTEAVFLVTFFGELDDG